MAIPQTNKPLSLPLLAFVTMIFLMRVNSDESSSFSFASFHPDDINVLILQGDADIDPSTQSLRLTKEENDRPAANSVGRVLYGPPIHIWGSSAVAVSFETTFTFVINNSIIPAEGLAFFLASPDTTILPNSGWGLLGLFNDSNDPSNSPDQVVAVEIDTFVNSWDPRSRHIGIDVNSIRSKENTSWELQDGAIGTAHISYSSVTQRLSAAVSYPDADPLTVSYDLELNTALPEWVRVGFSASTAALFFRENHHILSWSFNSTLTLNENFNNKQDSYIATVV